MNKTELVSAIAEKSELSKKDAEKALNAFIEAVTDELKNLVHLRLLTEQQEQARIHRQVLRLRLLHARLLSLRLVRL